MCGIPQPSTTTLPRARQINYGVEENPGSGDLSFRTVKFAIKF
jgi:hypothetical protein